MPSRRIFLSSWPAVGTTAIATVAILVHTGMLVADIVLFTAYVVVLVGLPGVFTWRLLLQGFHTGNRKPPTWFEDLSLGTIFGFGIQLPVYLVGLAIGAPLIVVSLPILVVVLSVPKFGRRVWTLPTGRVDWRVSWGLSAVSIYGLAWLATNVFPFRPMRLSAAKTPSIDETFHQALIGELSHHVPPKIPFLLDTRLDYHWFVHAQLATARWVTGIDSVVMLRQLLPTLALILTVAGLAAVALRLTRRSVTAVLAPAILVVGGFTLIGPHFDASTFSEPFMSKRYVSSPSETYGVMMSMPALLLILEVWRPRRPARKLTWLALIIALFALSGSKATYMPIFLCGAIAVWLFQLVTRRRIDKTASALVVIFFAVTLFAQIVLFGGQSGAMALDPFQTIKAALTSAHVKISPIAALAMTMTLLISWLLYGVGAVGLLRRGRWRDKRVIWLAVSVAAGVTVPFLLFRSGLSQMWFQRSVAELVVLLSVWGVARLLPNPLPRRRAVTLGAAAAAAGLVAFVASSYVESLREMPRHATLGALVLTVLTPFAIVAVFLLIRYLPQGRRLSWSRPSLAMLVAILLGLSLTNVYALTYDIVTNRTFNTGQFAALFTPGGVDAATYIKDHSSPDDIVATNVHCAKPNAPRCDNRNFWVSAYTERRIVIEGWGYTAITNADSEPGIANARIPTPYPERLAINDAAFQDPTPETVGRLVDTYGVKWLFVSKEYPADVQGLSSLTSMLTKRFNNDHYAVFEVNE